MKKLIFLIPLFFIQTVIGQTSGDLAPMRYGGIGFRLGFNQVHTLDRNTSALLYRSNMPTLGLFYQTSKNGNQLLGQLKVGRGSNYSEAFPDRLIWFRNEDVYGQVDSVSVPMRGNNTLIHLSMGYLREIDPSGPYRYQVGGEVANTVFYPQGFVQPGLMNLASLSPALGMEYQPAERMSFSLRITLPLVSLVSRSTYNNSVSQPISKKTAGFFDQGTRLVSWPTHKEIKVAAAFYFRTGKHWMGGLHYDFNLLKNTYPRDLTVMQSEMAISIQKVR